MSSSNWAAADPTVGLNPDGPVGLVRQQVLSSTASSHIRIQSFSPSSLTPAIMMPPFGVTVTLGIKGVRLTELQLCLRTSGNIIL